MVLPLDQMLKGGSAPATKTDSSSNLLRLPPATTSSTGASNTSSTSQGDIMDNAARMRSVTTTSVRGNNDA